MGKNVPFVEQAERLQAIIDKMFGGVARRFSEAMDIYESNVSKYRSGKEKITSKRLLKRLKQLGINPDWYLTGKGTMEYSNGQEQISTERKVLVKVYETPAHALKGVLITGLEDLTHSVKEILIKERYLNPDKIIGFRANGTSMVGVGIFPDSIIYASPELAIQSNGCIVIANLNGCIMVKYYKEGKLYSVPSVDTYEPIEEYLDDNAKILGVVFKSEMSH